MILINFIKRSLGLQVVWITLMGLGIISTVADENAIPINEVPRNIIQSIDASRHRMAECCKKYNEDASFLNFPYTRARSYISAIYQFQIYEIYSDQHYEFDVLNSGQIISFWNASIDTTIRNNATLATRKPFWKPMEAAAIACDFLRALLGTLPDDLSTQPGGNYDQQENPPKYMPLRWWIYWPRVAKEGYKFESDLASVRIYEKEGIRSASIQFGTRFSGVNFKPISKEEALPFAIIASKKMAQWGPSSGIVGSGPVSETPIRAYLKIVKPNHWGSPEVTSIYAPPDPNGRLIWEFIFPIYITDEEQKTHKYHHCVAVYIDAQTKEWLGGDIL
jgi:hypothetical protein